MTSTFLYGANIRANGIRQHYLRYGGSGQALILVPGITSPAITWGFVAERFGRTCDTYVLDARGRGLSESGDHLDYGLDALAADVAAFAHAVGVRDYALVGHSMGARIAIRAARAQALAAARLVLVDPPVSGPGRRPYPSPLPWYVDSLRLMRNGEGVDALRSFVPTWTEAQVRLRAEWLHTCDERAIVTAYAGFHEDDVHRDLPGIRIPTRLIAAGRGDVIRPDELDEILALMPHLETCRVEGAGHMIPWDDYEGFFDAFGTFLGQRV
jgi:N-formylmaleamate deformylase